MLVYPEGTSAAVMYRQNRVAKYLILNIFEKDAEIDEKRLKKKPQETMLPGVLQYFSEINAWRTGSLFSPS